MIHIFVEYVKPVHATQAVLVMLSIWLVISADNSTTFLPYSVGNPTSSGFDNGCDIPKIMFPRYGFTQEFGEDLEAEPHLLFGVCSEVSSAEFKWTILDGNVSIQLVDRDRMSLRSLFIYGKELPTGRFLLCLNVTLKPVVMSAESCTSLEATTAPLSVSITGGSRRFVGYGEEKVQMNTRITPSYPRHESVRYQWKCRMRERGDSSCFSADLQPDLNQANLTFSANALNPGSSWFHFTVAVSSDSGDHAIKDQILERRGEGVLNFSAYIDCDTCIDDSTVYGRSVVMRYTCVGCEARNTSHPAWQVWLIHGRQDSNSCTGYGESKPLKLGKDDAKSSLNDEFIEDTNRNRFDVQVKSRERVPGYRLKPRLLTPALFHKERHLINLTSDDSTVSTLDPITSLFAIKPGVLDASNTYLISVTNDGVEMAAQVVRPAHRHGGWCSVTPSTGLELSTQFVMECRNWISAQGPIVYELRYTTSQDMNPVVIYHGRYNVFNFSLPAGRPEYNYTVRLTVAVLDKGGIHGGWICPRFQPRVLPLDVDTINAEVTLNSSRFNQLRSTGNTAAILQDIRVVLTAINRTDALQNQIPYFLRIMTEVIPNSAISVDQITSTMRIMLTVNSEKMNKELSFCVWKIFRSVTEACERLNQGRSACALHILELMPLLTAKTAVDSNDSNFLDQLNKVSILSLAASSQKFVVDYLVVESKSLVVFIKHEEVWGSLNLNLLSDQVVVQRPESSCFDSTVVYLPSLTTVDTKGVRQEYLLHVKSYNCSRGVELPISNQLIELNVSLNKERTESQKTTFNLQSGRMNIHAVNLSDVHHPAAMLIQTELGPRTGVFTALDVYISLEKLPSPKKYITKFTLSSTQPSQKAMIAAESIKRGGMYYVGVGEFTEDGILVESKEVMADYSLSIVLFGCEGFDEKQHSWTSRSCQVIGSIPNNQTICRCRGCSYVRQSDWFPSLGYSLVNPLVSEGRNLDITSVWLVLLLVTIFLCFLFCSCRLDQGCFWRPIVLTDSASLHHHCAYKISVQTGFAWDAGTSAKVYVLLHGERGSTETFQLSPDDGRQIFSRSSRRDFIITVPESLGTLWHVHVWHDNSGPSPSFQLHHVTVTDLMKSQLYFFPCVQWFGVESPDGTVERELLLGKPCNTVVPLARGLLWWTLCDQHLWWSILMKPDCSRFTRLQRLACCLCLTLLYALLNLAAIRIGLAQESSHPWIVGVLTSAVLQPAHLVVAGLFRRIKVTHSRNTPTEEEESLVALYETRSDTSQSPSDGTLPGHGSVNWQECRDRTEFWNSNDLPLGKVSIDKQHSSLLLSVDIKETIERLLLPSVFRPITWTLLALTGLIASIGIITVGLTLTSTEVDLWLQCLNSSVISCMVLWNVIIVLVVLLYRVIRYSHRSVLDLFPACAYDSQVPIKLSLCNSLNCDRKPSLSNDPNKSRNLKFVRPPNENDLLPARTCAVKKRKAFTLVGNLVTCVVILLVLFVILHGIDQESNYTLNQVLSTTFTRSSNPAMTSVRSLPDWWKWVMTSFTVLLPSHSNTMETVGDSTSFFIGGIHLSTYQLENCSQEMLKDDVDLFTNTLLPHKPSQSTMILNSTRKEFLEQILSLNESLWTDECTWSAELWITLFNPSGNLFSLVKLKTERLFADTVANTVSAESVYLESPDNYSQYLAQVVLYVYIIYGVATYIFRRTQDPRHPFWKWLQAVFYLLGLTYIVCCERKAAVTRQFLVNVKRSEPELNLDSVISLDVVLKTLLGLLLACHLVMCSSLLRYSQVCRRLASVLALSAREVLYCAKFFVIFLLAFSLMGSLVFGFRQPSEFGGPWQSAVSLLTISLRGGRMLELSQQLGIIFNVFIFSYVAVVFFKVTAVPKSVLNASRRCHEKERHVEIGLWSAVRITVTYVGRVTGFNQMITRLFHWVGLKRMMRQSRCHVATHHQISGVFTFHDLELQLDAVLDHVTHLMDDADSVKLDECMKRVANESSDDEVFLN